ETRESELQEMYQPVPELAGVPHIDGAISELATTMPDHTIQIQGQKPTTLTTPANPVTKHGSGNDDQPQELETNSPLNLTHVETGNQVSSGIQQHSSGTPQQKPELNSANAMSTVSQSTNTAELEQLRAEEARLNAQIAQIQNLMQLDQERQRIRQKIQSLEVEKKSP